jgi:hypothetical protein
MLKDFLRQNSDFILREWFDQTINTYQPEMVRFLKAEKDPFSNPVRNTIVTSLGKIYEGILSGKDTGYVDGLEEIIKIRAVQDFSPSVALSFLFNLKNIIRIEISKIDQNAETLRALYDLDKGFDTLYKQAFDIYNDCRMKIQEIKIAEIKSRSKRAFEILHKK